MTPEIESFIKELQANAGARLLAVDAARRQLRQAADMLNGYAQALDRCHAQLAYHKPFGGHFDRRARQLAERGGSTPDKLNKQGQAYAALWAAMETIETFAADVPLDDDVQAIAQLARLLRSRVLDAK